MQQQILKIIISGKQPMDAPLSMWIAALIEVLEPAQRNKVLELINNYKSNVTKLYTPSVNTKPLIHRVGGYNGNKRS